MNSRANVHSSVSGHLNDDSKEVGTEGRTGNEAYGSSSAARAGSGWLSAKKVGVKTRAEAQTSTKGRETNDDEQENTLNALSRAYSSSSSPVIRRRSSSRLRSPQVDNSGNRKRHSICAR